MASLGRLLTPLPAHGHISRWLSTSSAGPFHAAPSRFRSRLVAVCDALDAMTSDRAHRPATGWDEAIADPDVVAAVRACVEDLHAIFVRSHNGTEPE